MYRCRAWGRLLAATRAFSTRAQGIEGRCFHADDDAQLRLAFASKVPRDEELVHTRARH